MEKTNTTSKKVAAKRVASKNNIKSTDFSKSAKTLFRSDASETAKLVKAGKDGAKQAIRASRALGLAITYLKDGFLYKEFPDGTKEILKQAPAKKDQSKKTSQLKKGMILYAKG